MNNKEFISELAQLSGTTQQNAQKMVLSVLEEMLSQIEENEMLQVPLFGTFEVKKRLERILVNPNNGKKMLVPPKLVLGFKPSSTLKERIQKGGQDE